MMVTRTIRPTPHTVPTMVAISAGLIRESELELTAEEADELTP